MTNKRQRQEAAGRWLRRERERRGLRTTGALARRMGVSDSLISRIETGNSAATDERAEQIAEALDMSVIEVRRGLRLWVPDEADSSAGGEEGSRLADEDEFDRLDRLYEEWKRDPARGPVLRGLLETWSERDAG